MNAAMSQVLGESRSPTARSPIARLTPWLSPRPVDEPLAEGFWYALRWIRNESQAWLHARRRLITAGRA